MTEHKKCEYSQRDSIFVDSPLYECLSPRFCRSQVTYAEVMYCAVELREINSQHLQVEREVGVVHIPVKPSLADITKHKPLTDDDSFWMNVTYEHRGVRR